MDREAFKKGDIVKHFKRETLSDKQLDSAQYLYRFIGVAINSDSNATENDNLVLYEALYGNHSLFTRTVEDFYSEVDHEKYPKIKQKYRFELFDIF